MSINISPAGAQKSKFRTDIQALRGLAVLLVVFYHAQLTELNFSGYLGVDLFFVISGFLITGIIRKEIEAQRFSFVNFYFRRAKRLLPAAFVVVAFIIICAPFVLTDVALSDLKGQVIGAVFFISNFVAWEQTGYFEAVADTKPLLHFWSLAVEEQYYLVMPLLLFFVPRKAWFSVVTSIVLASFGLSVYLALHYPDAAFYLTLTRMWELGLGSLAAIASLQVGSNRRFSLARIPAVLALVIIVFHPTGLPHPGLDALIVCIATLVIILGHNASSWENIWPIKAIARIGDISYSLYLVHWPVLVFTRAAYQDEPPQSAILIAVALSLILSAALYRFVEEPFRKNNPTRRRSYVGGLVACSAVIAVSPFIMAEATTSEVDYNHIRRNNYGIAFECSLKTSEPFSIKKSCKTTDHPKILVWGDSYAMAWSSVLVGKLREHGLQQITMGGCDPLNRVARVDKKTNSPYNIDYAKSCMRFNSNVLTYAKESKDIETVVIAGRMQTPLSTSNRLLTNPEGEEYKTIDVSPEVVTKALASLAEELHKAGKKVVFIAPPPANGSDIGACLERRARGKVSLGPQSDCNITMDDNRRYRGQTLDVMAAAADLAKVELLDIFGFLCKDGLCQTQIDGTILYRDYSHLTYSGSALIGERSSLANEVLEMAR